MTIEKIKKAGVKTKTFAAFGEIMLRLAAPGYERLLQSPVLSATFGGGEANVQVSLACLGQKTRFMSALPKNDIGRAAIRELRGFGVDTDQVVLVPDTRIGIYFLEKGANQRPSRGHLRPGALGRVRHRAGHNRLGRGVFRLRVVSRHRHHAGAVESRRGPGRDRADGGQKARPSSSRLT